MKLLVFTEYFPTSEDDLAGGVEKRAFHLLSELAKKNDITVLCSHQQKQARFSTINGIRVMRVGPTLDYSNKGNILGRFLFAFTAMLTGLILPGIDAIEAFSYLLYPATCIVGLFRRKPVIITFHESWTFHEWISLKGWWTGLFGIACTSLANLIGFTRAIAVSGATRQRLIEQHIPARKIDVVYNGLDLAQMRAVKGTPRELSVMTSARLIKSKRMDVLIKATAELRKEFPNISLTIHGDGDERKLLEQLIARLKLQKNVTITGRISKFLRVLQLRKKHKVFCLPSDVEGFGMVVVEALAEGIPVVCTDIPVLREVTCNGQGALLFKSGDSHDLARKLRMLFTDAKLYAQKQKEANACAAHYDWKIVARDAEKTYQKVLR